MARELTPKTYLLKKLKGIFKGLKSRCVQDCGKVLAGIDGVGNTYTGQSVFMTIMRFDMYCLNVEARFSRSGKVKLSIPD